MSMTEAWLSGPVEGVPGLLQPVAHALIQASRDMETAVAKLPSDCLWNMPSGVASVGFNLKHCAGVVDRLFTYARGESLTGEQFEYLRSEGVPSEESASELIAHFQNVVESALAQLRATEVESLLDYRGVGRSSLPSNVLGLLFHAAEHVQRHTGQMLVTSRIQIPLNAD